MINSNDTSGTVKHISNMRDYNDLTNNGLKEKLSLFDQNIASTLFRIATLNEEIGDDISDMADLLKKRVR